MIKLPRIVYKYRDWDNAAHRNLLIHNEFFMASPKDFNDPFDCRIAPNVNLLSDLEKSEYVNKLSIAHYDEAQRLGIDLNKAIPDLERRIYSGSIQEQIEKEEFESNDKYFGILSLSSSWNNVLLWSHYAKMHEGFCVGFFEKKLRDTFIKYPTGITKIRYSKEFPKIKPRVQTQEEQSEQMKRRFDKTGVKSFDWRYEKEYRIFINYFPKEPQPYERIVCYPTNAISEVILGIRIGSKNRDEIVSICKQKNLSVYQAKKSAFRFEIEKDLIK